MEKRRNSLILAVTIFCLSCLSLSFKTRTTPTTANVNALVSEEGNITLDCWKTISILGDDPWTHVTCCVECTPVLIRTWSFAGTCQPYVPPPE